MSNWYLNYITKEIEQLQKDEYTGKIDYQFNFFKGGIASLTINQSKTVKEPNEKN